MAKRRKKNQSLVPTPAEPDTARLLGDLRGLIDAARDRVARAVNAGLVLLYWGIGERIRREILGEQRAAYGEQIVQTVSAQLTAEYGKGFSRFALSRMLRLAELLPDREIVAALSQQLGWSHFMELIPLSDPLKRDFYAEMCRLERWSVRTLREKVAGCSTSERPLLGNPPRSLNRNWRCCARKIA